MENKKRLQLINLTAIIFDYIDKTEKKNKPIIDVDFETIEILNRLGSKLRDETSKENYESIR